jgi:hypothetical protein
MNLSTGEQLVAVSRIAESDTDDPEDPTEA